MTTSRLREGDEMVETPATLPQAPGVRVLDEDETRGLISVGDAREAVRDAFAQMDRRTQ